MVELPKKKLMGGATVAKDKIVHNLKEESNLQRIKIKNENQETGKLDGLRVNQNQSKYYT